MDIAGCFVGFICGIQLFRLYFDVIYLNSLDRLGFGGLAEDRQARQDKYVQEKGKAEGKVEAFYGRHNEASG